MQEQVQNESFHSDANKIFESYLATDVKPRIMIRNKKTGLVIEHSATMNYDKLFFDTKGLIYKITDAGTIVKVESNDFDTVVVKAL